MLDTDRTWEILEDTDKTWKTKLDMHGHVLGYVAIDIDKAWTQTRPGHRQGLVPVYTVLY